MVKNMDYKKIESLREEFKKLKSTQEKDVSMVIEVLIDENSLDHARMNDLEGFLEFKKISIAPFSIETCPVKNDVIIRADRVKISIDKPAFLQALNDWKKAEKIAEKIEKIVEENGAIRD